MMRVRVETGPPLEVCRKARIVIQKLLAPVFLAPLALIGGCSGVVSNSSPSTPPPQAQTYSVSGTLSPTAGGGGATVTLSGAATATATATGSGTYTFTGLANGSYAVTPSRTGYAFSPTSQSATVSGANVTGINFAATPAQAHTATASWTASSSVVSGYNVYRGTVSGGPYTKLNGSLVALLMYTDTTVQSGQTYFFVTTAVDGSGNESIFSTEVRAVIP
jgi:hypothetical protein